jgi:hypothetical protein
MMITWPLPICADQLYTLIWLSGVARRKLRHLILSLCIMPQNVDQAGNSGSARNGAFGQEKTTEPI